MPVTEVRHPHSRVLLQGVRPMKAGETIEATDWTSMPDGTWKKCPESRIGSCVTQDELNHGVVWAQRVETDTPLNVRVANMQAGIGVMHRLW